VKALLTVLLIATSAADELKFKFKSPTFNGIGYSAHLINLENMKYSRIKSIRDEIRALELQLQILDDRKPINAFLSNLQTRIYSELSKQVTEQLFAETGADNGTFTLDGNTVVWGKLGDTITLTVYDVDGKVTTITIPVGSLSLPETPDNENTDNSSAGS
jgi:hypothetical protein